MTLFFFLHSCIKNSVAWLSLPNTSCSLLGTVCFRENIILSLFSCYFCSFKPLHCASATCHNPSHQRYKINNDPCTKVLTLKIKVPWCQSLTVNWDVVIGECENTLCSNMELFQPVIFCFSQTKITMKNGLSCEILFCRIVIFHF